MRRTAVLLAISLMAAAGLSGCTKKAAEPEVLKVGNMGTSIKAAMVVLAHEMGYYEEEGLKV